MLAVIRLHAKNIYFLKSQPNPVRILLGGDFCVLVLCNSNYSSVIVYKVNIVQHEKDLISINNEELTRLVMPDKKFIN